jgi:hypothetical protein
MDQLFLGQNVTFETAWRANCVKKATQAGQFLIKQAKIF